MSFVSKAFSVLLMLLLSVLVFGSSYIVSCVALGGYVFAVSTAFCPGLLLLLNRAFHYFIASNSLN